MIKLRTKNNLINNHGSTLIEMIVSFALLAIFLVSAATVIASVTTMYYEVKGENYSKQVSDIVLNKIEAEIDGSVFVAGEDETNLRIQKADDSEMGKTDTGENINKGASVLLTDKTGTKVKIYRDPTDKDVVIHYFPIGTQKETDWRFDQSVYNHFTVEELTFMKASEVSSYSELSNYGIDSVPDYGPDVIAVFLKIHSGRYGDYYAYRFVNMCNYSETP